MYIILTHLKLTKMTNFISKQKTIFIFKILIVFIHMVLTKVRINKSSPIVHQKNIIFKKQKIRNKVIILILSQI